MLSRTVLIFGVAGLSFSAIAAPPSVTDAIKAKEWECSGVSLGLLKEAGKRDVKTFPVCIVDVTCRAKWDIEGYAKGQGFMQPVACKPKEGACPDGSEPAVRACVAEASADGRDFDWQTAPVSTRATRKNGDGLSCSYNNLDGTQTAGLILRDTPNPKGGVIVDGICASRVNCKPELKPSVVACAPRRVGDSPEDFVCPQAVDCVSEKVSLDKPKVEVAARPHGGTPAQTVSNSSGSTHSGSDQKR